MPTPTELRARAAELENRIPPAAAGPRTDDERLFAEKAPELRAEADRLEADAIPGTTGTLPERISEVLGNEVPGAYADLATARVLEVVTEWQDDATATLDGVRAWFELYRPQLSRSAAQALDSILAEPRDEVR
ncbi:hypothetical protein [Streptomyces sp. NPDC054865]